VVSTVVEVPEVDPLAPRRDPPRAPRWAGPAAGLAAGAAAVGAGMLFAALADVVSPIDAVGSEFIDVVPRWLKDLAIDWFGTNDKVALRAGIVTVLALASLVVGWVGRQRTWAGVGGIAAFGVVGALAARARPDGGAGAAWPALAGALVGGVLLVRLLALVRAGDGARERPRRSRAPLGWDRRRFVLTAGAAGAGAGLALASARRLESQRLDRLRAAAPDELPVVAPDGGAEEASAGGGGTPGPASPVVPPGAQLSPITPFLTPNDDFYLIDTALSVPRIDVASWAVEIVGMVDRPLRLSYDDLLARPQVERIVTIACVSNEVGGDLVGNARWQGVLLADLLREAGVAAGAEQVFSTSVDGWTCGFPVAAALDGRDAMIALGMNGEPLPLRHGFPARLIVPGLYGYVSATKWLERIELTTWDDAVGYWVPRGWSREAPIKTQSRIDVPRAGDDLAAGRVAIAGVAWAQQRGVAAVEVRIDRGEWRRARLGADVSADAWRQWVLEWDATPGEHTIQVRATDGEGDVQTEEVARPDPDGATGHHTRTVRVRA